MYAQTLESCPESKGQDDQWRIFGSELAAALRKLLSEDSCDMAQLGYQELTESLSHGFHVELAFALNVLMPVTTEICLVRERFTEHDVPLHICLRICDSHGALPLFLNLTGIKSHDEFLSELAHSTGNPLCSLAIADADSQLPLEKMPTYSAHRMENLIQYLVSHPELWLSCPS